MLCLCYRLYRQSASIFTVVRPENLFDYLSGLLADTSSNDRLTMFLFSMYTSVEKDCGSGILTLCPPCTGIYDLGFDLKAFISSRKPVAFVDL